MVTSVTKYSIEDSGFVPLPTATVCIMNPLDWIRVQNWLENCGEIGDSNLRGICETYALENGRDFLPKNDQIWLRDLQFELQQANLDKLILKLSYPLEDLFVTNISKTTHDVSEKCSGVELMVKPRQCHNPGELSPLCKVEYHSMASVGVNNLD